MPAAVVYQAMENVREKPQGKAKLTAPGKLPSPSPKRSLAKAFRSFANAAGSLENSYSQLQMEVSRLRLQLEKANQDLTQSLEENKRIRAYLSRTLECLPCGVLVVGREYKMKLANSAGLCLLGMCQSSTQASMSISKEVMGKLHAVTGSQLAGAETEWPVETEDGQRFLSVSHTMLDDGSDREWIFILRDITESKRLERERETARRTQDLAQMAMLLAHEIRNPLGSLELFAGLLADATEDRPVLHKWVDQVQAGLRTLSATVNNVLQFHSEPRSDLRPVDIAELLRETLDFLQPLARQRGMRLEFNVHGAETTFCGDVHRLQQVFFNLALNAFRAMSPGGVLRVSVDGSDHADEPAIRVVFRDEGTGIPSLMLSRIFDAGFTTNPGSPGLGLALTKKVVEQHKGNIQVESDTGKGTTFTLMFPRLGEGNESSAGR
jgi:signal transduction histidine kinase